MKIAILAGGVGTRMMEETETKPKPMVEIGEHPVLWHILKYYAHFGFKEFFIALGYKGEIIKRYFLDYHRLNGSMTVDLGNGEIQKEDKKCEDWKVHLIDTGDKTLTGGRIKRLEPWLQDGTFMVTYGDGVSNVRLDSLLEFHRSQGRIATMTAVRPPARFGGLVFNSDMKVQFSEKSQVSEGWINGGFMVFEPEIFKYLKDDGTRLEQDALECLASEGQLVAYKHEDFWQCMDTLRDIRMLENLWQKGNPPWKVWSE